MGCLNGKGQVSKNDGVHFQEQLSENTGPESNPVTPSNLDSEPSSVRGRCHPPNRQGVTGFRKWTTGRMLAFR